MLPNSNLQQEDARWLVEFYAPKMGYRIDNSTIQWHNKAFNLIKGSNDPVPSCNCHWVSASRIAQSLYGQHEAEIKAVAYPVKKTRKKK